MDEWGIAYKKAFTIADTAYKKVPLYYSLSQKKILIFQILKIILLLQVKV